MEINVNSNNANTTTIDKFFKEAKKIGNGLLDIGSGLVYIGTGAASVAGKVAYYVVYNVGYHFYHIPTYCRENENCRELTGKISKFVTSAFETTPSNSTISESSNSTLESLNATVSNATQEILDPLLKNITVSETEKKVLETLSEALPEQKADFIENATTSVQDAINQLKKVPSTIQEKAQHLIHPMVPGYIGSAIGGAVLTGSVVKFVFNFPANPTFQNFRKQWPTLALAGGGAALIAMSQLAAENTSERIALAVSAIVFSVLSGVTVASSEMINSSKPPAIRISELRI